VSNGRRGDFSLVENDCDNKLSETLNQQLGLGMCEVTLPLQEKPFWKLRPRTTLYLYVNINIFVYLMQYKS